MDAQVQPFVVGIRFQKIGKIYHFDASNARDLQVGDFAVVETSRGRQLGEVIEIVHNPTPPPDGAWKPIHHKATARDLALRQLWQKKEVEATIACRAKLVENPTPGVKIVASEFTFDGERLAFLYSTEAEGKVDLRKLRTVMQRLYPRSQVEMRQVGPRDVAKLLGGMGACGLESRCCSMFLTDFSPISIKMAKEQGISLTPTEITGMCGRLRCCLVYEYEQYMEARKTLPKRNKRVVTPKGEGKVVDVYPLKQSVIVELDANGVRTEFFNYELQPWDELEALRRKSLAPCAIHGDGVCTCKRDADGALSAANEDEEIEAEADFGVPLQAPPPPAAPGPQAAQGSKGQGKQRPFKKRNKPHKKPPKKE